jgi:glycosyltransferase involved in cell wall biosynthesis
MTLLIISYVFPPFYSVGGSIRVVKFIKYLSSLGWRIKVLTIGDERESETQKKQGSESLLSDVPHSVEIVRTSGSGEPSAALLAKGRALRQKSRLAAPVISLLGRLRGWISRVLLVPDGRITWLPYAYRYGRRVLKQENVSAIFCTCPPHSAAVIAAILSFVTRTPLVLDYRDDWIDTPWFRSKSAFRQTIERFLESWVVGRSSKVICVTPWSRRSFLQRYPKEAESKFALIPNGVDLDDFRLHHAGTEGPAPNAEKFNIVHAGLLPVHGSWYRDPGPFFQAIAKVTRRVPGTRERIRLQFTGSLPQAYKDAAAQAGVGDLVQELGYLSRQDFNDLLHNASLHLAINYAGFTTLVPGKIYEYWAVGRAPILLLSAQGAASELLATNKIGMSVEPTDVEGIVRIVEQEIHTHMEGTQRHIGTHGLNRYDRKELAMQLHRTLSETLSSESQVKEPTSLPYK